jgi:hypothetical protein
MENMKETDHLEYNIKTENKKIICENVDYQDRVEWRALLNTIANLEVQYGRRGEFHE